MQNSKPLNPITSCDLMDPSSWDQELRAEDSPKSPGRLMVCIISSIHDKNGKAGSLSKSGVGRERRLIENQNKATSNSPSSKE